MSINFQHIHDRDTLAPIAANMIATAITDDVSKNVRASLMLSGGSTPGATYDKLSAFDLPWADVDIGLVDDRWVNEDNAGSNGALIRQALIKDKAKKARFIPMKNEMTDHIEAQSIVEKDYSLFTHPYSAVILGMGLDGHTASWFPNAAGLSQSLDTNNSNRVQAVTAIRSDVTGDYLNRMTLTLSAIAQSKMALLLLTGQQKRDVFERACNDSQADLPIKYAINALGDRLTVLYAD